MENLEQIKVMVDSCTDFVEECILLSAVRDRKFWVEYCVDRVNTPKEKNKRFKKFEHKFEDFSKPILNILYDVVSQCYLAFGDSMDELSYDVLTNVLNAKVQSDILDETTFATAVEVLKNFWDVDLEHMRKIAKQTFSVWFEKRRTLQLAESIKHSPNKSLTVDDVLKQLRDITTASDGLNDKVEAPTALQVLQQAKEDPKILKSYKLPSLGDFGIPLGGGLIPGELGLVMTPPNGGKTVMANQMVADLCLGKVRTLLFTTEQSADAMFLRQFSNVGNINFERLSSGYNPKAFKESENKRIEEYCERIDPYLRIEDWRRNPGTIETHMEGVMEKYINKGFEPQVVIFDWLGGGMASVPEDRLRNHMIAVSKLLKDVASKKYGASTVLFAQAGAKKCSGVWFVNETHGDNNTMLHTYADWGCGISRLKEGEDKKQRMKAPEDKPVAKRQVMNFFKTRNAPENWFWFVRDFQFQRFRSESGSHFFSDPLKHRFEDGDK